eukprot:scaffold102967_cov59-Phaeocystis_antarctica.AAC.1
MTPVAACPHKRRGIPIAQTARNLIDCRGSPPSGQPRRRLFAGALYRTVVAEEYHWPLAKTMLCSAELRRPLVVADPELGFKPLLAKQREYQPQTRERALIALFARR